MFSVVLGYGSRCEFCPRLKLCARVMGLGLWIPLFLGMFYSWLFGFLGVCTIIFSNTMKLVSLILFIFFQ